MDVFKSIVYGLSPPRLISDQLEHVSQMQHIAIGEINVRIPQTPPMLIYGGPYIMQSVAVGASSLMAQVFCGSFDRTFVHVPLKIRSLNRSISDVATMQLIKRHDDVT